MFYQLEGNPTLIEKDVHFTTVKLKALSDKEWILFSFVVPLNKVTCAASETMNEVQELKPVKSVFHIIDQSLKLKTGAKFKLQLKSSEK